MIQCSRLSCSELRVSAFCNLRFAFCVLCVCVLIAFCVSCVLRFCILHVGLSLRSWNLDAVAGILEIICILIAFCVLLLCIICILHSCVCVLHFMHFVFWLHFAFGTLDMVLRLRFDFVYCILAILQYTPAFWCKTVGAAIQSSIGLGSMV